MFNATSKTDGIISNSFYEIESEFEDYLNRENSPPKVWSVGPLCLAAAPKMLDVEKPILYVAFGSLAEITIEQFRELAIGLENSGEHFLWVLCLNQWVDQLEILRHDSVKGFMSHCVPLLGFPITADQYWNARMVEEYYGIGVKFVTKNGSVRGFFNSECIAKKVKELMNIESEKGKEIWKSMKNLSQKARNAMEEGGSSWHALKMLIDQIIGGKKKKQ
ncbi:hypothetical protein MKX03_031458 [Papaver bracteatum]|nr:hypothetical protein MKX03_031458 [Papaver bracteatum]